MKQSARRKGLKQVFLYIVWIALTLITLFPIYWMFLISARSRVELFSNRNLYQTTIFWENFVRPLFQGVYGQYVVNSLIVATGNTLLVVVLAVLAAYALSRYRVKGGQNIFFWTITNRMAPPAAFMLPLFLLYSRVLRIGDLQLYDTHIGLILVYCVFNLPFAIWLLKGIIDGIPTSLDDAARVDGASTVGIIRRIIVPLAAPGIAITALLAWIFAWNEFLFATTLTSVKARTITTGLVEFVTVVGTNWGEMAAMAIISLLPALLFLVLVQRYIIAGLTFGAVRE
ncbi:MAG: Trehalose transport system permease protein SugB [Firmicutes bacterium]|nr:Trehalose transport system permease protein SugB [Bacillota bacterium]